MPAWWRLWTELTRWCFFDEETPLELIERIVPQVLVKGADYNIDQVVGREVVLVELVFDRSTSAFLDSIKGS